MAEKKLVRINEDLTKSLTHERPDLPGRPPTSRGQSQGQSQSGGQNQGHGNQGQQQSGSNQSGDE